MYQLSRGGGGGPQRGSDKGLQQPNDELRKSSGRSSSDAPGAHHSAKAAVLPPKAKQLAMAPAPSADVASRATISSSRKSGSNNMERVDDDEERRRRNTNKRPTASNPTGMRPGAVAVRGPDIRDPHDEEVNISYASEEEEDTSSFDSYLVSAQVVQPQNDVLSLEAQAQDIENRVRAQLFQNTATAQQNIESATIPKKEEEEASSQQGCTRRRWVLGGLLGLLVVVGVVVGAIVGTSSGSSSSPAKTQSAGPEQPVNPPPITAAPSSAPTSFVQPCMLCEDGSEPNLEAEVGRGTTCADLETSLGQLDDPFGPICRSGQAQGWYSCSCPTLPNRPVTARCSAECDEDSRPDAHDSQQCRDFETYVEAVALQVDQCTSLIALTPELCQCSTEIADLRTILSGVVSNETDLLDTATPQYMAMRWLAKDDPANLTISGTPINDLRMRYIGALLWFSLGGENWKEPFNFLSADSVCDWNDGDSHGLFCSQGFVKRILLEDNALVGSLPGVELAAFGLLEHIRLEDNDIRGTLPSSINLLTNLRSLVLDRNTGFGGSLPPELFELDAITQLWIDGCSLVGSLPSNVGDATSLTTLDMQSNQLSGSIPSSISQLTNLGELLLNDNSLNGTLPSMSALTNLRRLFLSQNSLTGTIPSPYGQIRSLARLGLQFNELTGTVPDFSPATALQLLYLNDNVLEGNVGQIFARTPTSRLEELSLSSNKFTGSIPSDIGSFAVLDILFLYENQLITGTLPTELGLLTRMSSYLNLELMAINGTLPTELGRMTNLLELTVSGNLLKGTIPTELGGMRSLSLLDINTNGITGTIPSELGKLQAMEQISFAENHGITGTVPSVLYTPPNLVLFLVQGTRLTGSLEPFCQAEIMTVRADCAPPAEITCECCEACL